jgi:hypothetical protein
MDKPGPGLQQIVGSRGPGFLKGIAQIVSPFVAFRPIAALFHPIWQVSSGGMELEQTGSYT